MGKVTLYPQGNERNAVINETAFQIMMRLFHKLNTSYLENTTCFKDFQEELNLHEVVIDQDLPKIPVSRSSFEKALNLAKKKNWVFLNRVVEQEGMNQLKKFQIGLTIKGKDIAQKEWEMTCQFEN